MLKIKEKSIFINSSLVWIFAGLLSYFIGTHHELSQIFYPLINVGLIIIFLHFLCPKYFEYILFFSISITGLFGLTQNLTGSHAESNNFFLYGLSFYTASIAYLLANDSLRISKILNITNPLLLITGPIALYVKSLQHKKTLERYKYFVPFIIIGLFMFQIVASPLTNFFFLLEHTDIVSSILFAFIFEIFVYMNFCGLSLAIYGFFGLFGYRIPLNFRQPFSSNNIVEFWRGWHVSLSEVLKILFYNPIRKKNSLMREIFVGFFASAMWHGITFNFFIWGVFH